MNTCPRLSAFRQPISGHRFRPCSVRPQAQSPRGVASPEVRSLEAVPVSLDKKPSAEFSPFKVLW